MRKSLPPNLRKAVYQKCDGKCAYCGSVLQYDKMQVDHYYPHSMSDYYSILGIDTDDKNNLMPSCRKCNHYKRGNTPSYFRVIMNTLHERLIKIYIVEVAVNFGMFSITPFNGKFYFETLPPSSEFPPYEFLNVKE